MHVSSAIVSRDYRTADAVQVRALLHESFGTSAGFDYFEAGNPLGTAVRVVAEADGRVVGFNSWNPWRLPFGGGATVYQSGASVVAHAARGQGVFARLLAAGVEAARARRISLFVGFPNPQSYGSFTRAGWHTVATMSAFGGVVVPWAALRRQVEPSRPASSPSGFIAWRYRAVASCAVSLPHVGHATLFYRKLAIKGVPVIRVLDLLDNAGMRALSYLDEAIRQFPYASIWYSRAPNGATPRFRVMRDPRRWRTPVIAFPLDGEGETSLAALAASPWMLGDIDAA